jgi:hypothetical protein
VIATGKFVQLDHPDTDETILPPADNPWVISVGASDDPDTSRSSKSKRPDVSIPSLVQLKNSTAVYSTSAASAIVAAVTAIYLGTGTSSDRTLLIEKLNKLYSTKKTAPPQAEAKSSPQPKTVAESTPPPAVVKPVPQPKRVVDPVSREISPRLPHVNPVASIPCYPPIRPPVIYPGIERILSSGAVPVRYGGLTVVVIDPEYAAKNGLIPPAPAEYVYMTASGLAILERDEIHRGMPSDYYLIYSEYLPICE